jgi:hypothetical protein
VRFETEMKAAGFRDVEVDYVPREIELADADQVWGMMTSGAPPVKMLLYRIGSEGESRLRDALNAIIEKRWGGGPVRLTNTATVGSGTA